MSKFTERKAQNLVDTCSIVQIDPDTYQVKSSTRGKSYIIESNVCSCAGFRFRRDCSHVRAANIMQESSKITSEL